MDEAPFRIVVFLEDNENDRFLYRRMSQGAGISDVCVSDIAAARRVVTESAGGSIAVVVLDGNVPQDDKQPFLVETVSFAKELHEKFPELMLIAASGDEGLNKKLMDAGCQLALGKKALSPDFKFVLAEALGRNQE